MNCVDTIERNQFGKIQRTDYTLSKVITFPCKALRHLPLDHSGDDTPVTNYIDQNNTT